MTFKAILLFGAPGCGKGTQGKVLGAIPGYFHSSCGEVFRSLKADSELGRVFMHYSSRGLLVPDAPTVELWRQYIENQRRAGLFNPETDTLVLDGIPRNVAQAQLLDNALDVRAILHLNCAEPERLVQRLQRRALRENRLDDANLEVIRDRLRTYERETRPVLDWYGTSRLHEIDATQSPIEVLQDVLAVLVKL